MDKRIGNYSFIIGVVIAVVLGLAIPALAQAKAVLTTILVLLGLVVGFLNVASKDTKDFLLIAIILVVASSMAEAGSLLKDVQLIGPYLSGIFGSVMVFLVPAVLVVGLKAIYYMTKTAKKK